MKALLMFILLTTCILVNAQTFVALDKIETDDGNVLLEAVLVNPTAPTHTYEFIQENPYRIWFTNSSTKWLPYSNANYHVIVTGIIYTPPNTITQLYRIRSNTVNALKAPMRSEVFIQQNKNNDKVLRDRK